MKHGDHVKSYLLIFSFCLFVGFISSSCEHYEIEETKSFPTPSEEVLNECLKANPLLKKEQCNIKDCFSDPFVLNGIIKITKDTIDILNELSVNYMINSATLFGALRFGAPLPWDDDSDLDVIEETFTPHLLKIQNKLAIKGYELKAYKSHPLTKEIDFWQVVFTETSYKAMILKINEDLIPKDVERLWIAYKAGDHVPHLDIFPLAEEGDWLHLKAPIFSFQGYTRTQRYESKVYPFLKENYQGPKEAGKIYESWYKGKEVVRDFVVKPPHTTKCANPRFKDIRDYPKTFDYMSKYLKHIFGEDYTPANLP